MQQEYKVVKRLTKHNTKEEAVAYIIENNLVGIALINYEPAAPKHEHWHVTWEKIVKI